LWAAGFGPTAWGPYKDSPHDYGHFSATGHARGGMVNYAGAFGDGGAVTATRPTMALFGENGPETAMFLPAQRGHFPKSANALLSGLGAGLKAAAHKAKPPGLLANEPWRRILGIPPVTLLSGKAPDHALGAADVLKRITGFRGDLSDLQHELSIIEGSYNQNQENLTYVGTEPEVIAAAAQGLDHPVVGDRNEGAITRRVAQIQVLIGLAKKIFDTYTKIVRWTDRLVKAYQNIADRMVTQRDKAQAAIEKAQATIASTKSQLAQIKLTGLKGKALKAAQDRRKPLEDRITAQEKVIKAQQTIHDNAKSDIATYLGDKVNTQGDLTTALDDRDGAWQSWQQYKIDQATVRNTAGNVTTQGSSSSGPSADDLAKAQQIATLSQQLAVEANKRTAISETALTVLGQSADLFPGLLGGRATNFAGAFAAGGMVTASQPTMAVFGDAGTETAMFIPGGVSSSSSSPLPVHVHVHVHDGAVDPNKIEVIAEGAAQAVLRSEVRSGTRSLPGRGGGVWNR
jgi:hypothetical protein